ncbi:MAG: sulfatase-like hydrolase/transferase [Verrucomicrobia bacterium]|nr:sulfatase-like hydrolase/transferase [Verrucomicrobiota bacterium]
MKIRLPSLLLALAIAAVSAAHAAKPNIILIAADDLGYADIGVHGCKEFATPNIDSLAKNGLRFAAGYATSAVCAPSRAGFLSGRYQDHFGFQGNPKHGASDWGLPLDERTIADRLKTAGYKTAAFGKWHLGEKPEQHPMSRGFDEYFGFLAGMHDYFKAEDPNWGAIMRGREKAELKEYLTFAIAKEACGFIERQKDAPFFIYLAFNAPHTPSQAPEDYLKKAAHIADKQRQTYAAMVMALDDSIGRVLKTLREKGLEENTLIFFLSDNGGPLIKGSAPNGSRNDPLRGGKLQMWEGGIRVPFMIQWKGHLPAGKTIAEPVISLDIQPTACAAAGVETKPEWKLDGLNLLPLLEGKAEHLARTDLFWKFGNDQFAIRGGDWKLVKVHADKGLFNLPKDISETTDRTAEQGKLAEDLKARWDVWETKNPTVNLKVAAEKKGKEQ